VVAQVFNMMMEQKLTLPTTGKGTRSTAGAVGVAVVIFGELEAEEVLLVEEAVVEVEAKEEVLLVIFGRVEAEEVLLVIFGEVEAEEVRQAEEVVAGVEAEAEEEAPAVFSSYEWSINVFVHEPTIYYCCCHSMFTYCNIVVR